MTAMETTVAMTHRMARSWLLWSSPTITLTTGRPATKQPWKSTWCKHAASKVHVMYVMFIYLFFISVAISYVQLNIIYLELIVGSRSMPDHTSIVGLSLSGAPSYTGPGRKWRIIDYMCIFSKINCCVSPRVNECVLHSVGRSTTGYNMTFYN